MGILDLSLKRIYYSIECVKFLRGVEMLVVENVSHGFGARTILENVSFRLRKGEHIALVGANGEGKSSF